LAVIGVLSSVVAAFYYLRIIKLMYFDDAAQPIDTPCDYGLKAVLTLTAAAMLLLVFWPAPVVDGALIAAKSLTGG
jgi:NADH-quinone oxidoreductase subunit N